MARYVIRRLGWTVAVLFLITVITFLLSRVVPANPAAMVTGLGASTEQIQEVRRIMGLDKPLTVQYERYMRGLVQLDLGKSIRTQRAVTDDLRDFLPATFEMHSSIAQRVPATRTSSSSDLPAGAKQT